MIEREGGRAHHLAHSVEAHNACIAIGTGAAKTAYKYWSPLFTTPLGSGYMVGKSNQRHKFHLKVPCKLGYLSEGANAGQVQ